MELGLPYTQQIDFSEEETNGVAGRSSVRTDALDTEFVNLQDFAARVRTALAIFTDGEVVNDSIIGVGALKPEVLSLIGSAGFNVRGSWAQSTAYSVSDLVKRTTGTYVCITAHTSTSTFDATKFTSLWDSAVVSGDAVSFDPVSGIPDVYVQGAIETVYGACLKGTSNLSDLSSASTSRTNLSVYSRLEDQKNYGRTAQAAGTADAFYLDAGYITPDITALVDGLTLDIIAVGSCGATPTFTPNLGVVAEKPIVRYGNQSLTPGDIYGPGHVIRLRYQGGIDKWELMTPASTGLPFLDTNPLIRGSADGTKGLRLEIDANVGTGVTRVLTAPAADGTLLIATDRPKAYISTAIPSAGDMADGELWYTREA